jgi:2-hydroxy-6-oxonona-2,4-dienedioate hydrolase
MSSISMVPQGRLVPTGTEQMFVIETGNPAGVPLIFLQGGGAGCSGWTDFGPLAPYFEDRRCLYPDLIQYGQSSKPAIKEPIWSYHARHIIAMMDVLRVAKADFVCSSVGGSAALCMAARYPDRVLKVTVSGAEPLASWPKQAEFPARGSASPMDGFYGGEGPTPEKMRGRMADNEWYDASRIPDATVNIRMAHISQPDFIELLGTPNARGTAQDLSRELLQIQAPVLFLWGKFDPFVRWEYALYLATQVKNSDVYIMDKVSHHGEEEWPSDYAAIVRGFLAREAFG